MSTVIQSAERQIAEAKKRIHDEKVREGKERLLRLAKNGTDQELAEACRSMAGMLMPPTRSRKPKTNSPIS